MQIFSALEISTAPSITGLYIKNMQHQWNIVHIHSRLTKDLHFTFADVLQVSANSFLEWKWSVGSRLNISSHLNDSSITQNRINYYLKNVQCMTFSTT